MICVNRPFEGVSCNSRVGDELTTKIGRLESFTFLDMNDDGEEGCGSFLRPLGGAIDSGPDSLNPPCEAVGKGLERTSSASSGGSLQVHSSVPQGVAATGNALGETPECLACTEHVRTVPVDRSCSMKIGEGGVSGGITRGGSVKLSRTISQSVKEGAPPTAAHLEGACRVVGDGGGAIVTVEETCKSEGSQKPQASLAMAFEEGISGGISRGHSVRLSRTLSREMREAVLGGGQADCNQEDEGEMEGGNLTVVELKRAEGSAKAQLANPKLSVPALPRSISGGIAAQAPIKLARTISQAARDSICGASFEPSPRSKSISPRGSRLASEEGMATQVAAGRSRSLSPQAADCGSVSGGLSRSQSVRLSRTISAAVKEGAGIVFPEGASALCDRGPRCKPSEDDSWLDKAASSGIQVAGAVGTLSGPIYQSGGTSPRLGRPPSRGDGGGSVDMAISQAVRDGLSCQMGQLNSDGGGADCPQAHLPSPRLMEGGISGGISRGNSMRMSRTISQSVRQVVCGVGDSPEPAAASSERGNTTAAGDAQNDVWVTLVENSSAVSAANDNASPRPMKSIRPVVPVTGEGISSGLSTGHAIRLNRTVSLDIVEGRMGRPEARYGRSSSLPSRLQPPRRMEGGDSSPEGGTPKLGRSVSGGLSSRGAIRLSRTISSEVKESGMPDFQRSLSLEGRRSRIEHYRAYESEPDGDEWESSEGENDLALEQELKDEEGQRLHVRLSPRGAEEEKFTASVASATKSAWGGGEIEVQGVKSLQTRGRQGREDGVGQSAESDTSALLSLMEQQSLQARRSRPNLFANKMSALLGKPVGGTLSPGWGTPDCESPMADARVGTPRRSFGEHVRGMGALLDASVKKDELETDGGPEEGALPFEEEPHVQRRKAPGQGQQALEDDGLKEGAELRARFENILEKAVAKLMNLADTRHDVVSEWGERRRSCQRLESFFISEGRNNAEVIELVTRSVNAGKGHTLKTSNEVLTDCAHRLVLEMALEEKRLESVASMEGEAELRRLMGGIAAAFEAHGKAVKQAAESADVKTPSNPEDILNDPWVTAHLIGDRIQAFESQLVAAKKALTSSAERLSAIERERVISTRHALLLALACADAKQGVPTEEAVSRAESYVTQLANPKVEELWEEQLEQQMTGGNESTAEGGPRPAHVWFLGDHIRCQGLLERKMEKGEWEELYAVLYQTGSLCWFKINNIGTPTDRMPGSLDVGIAAVRGVEDGITMLLTMYTPVGDVKDEVLLKASSSDERSRWCKAVREVSVDALQKQVEAKLVASPVSSPRAGSLRAGNNSTDISSGGSPSFIRQLGIPGPWPFTNNFQTLPLEISNSEVGRSGDTSPSVTSKTPTDDLGEAKGGAYEGGNGSPRRKSTRSELVKEAKNAASQSIGIKPTRERPIRFDDDMFHQGNLRTGPSPFSDYEGPVPSSRSQTK